MITVYADVLVAVNILLTYIFLVCTRVFTRMPTYKWGIALASLFGGLSSLVIFLGEFSVVISIVLKLLISSIIIFFGFFPKNLRQYLKTMLSFFGVSIIFGGAMFFAEITFNSEKILYLNGTVYFDIDLKYLIGCTFLIYGIFTLVNCFFEKRAYKNELYTVEILFRGVNITLRGFVDTGNALKDILTGKYVFVCQLSSLACFFTYEELCFLKNNIAEKMPDSLQGIIRLVPALTVGENSLLKTFTPDKVQVYLGKNKKELKNVCIGIVNKNLSSGEYDLLLNKNAVEYER